MWFNGSGFKGSRFRGSGVQRFKGSEIRDYLPRKMPKILTRTFFDIS